jgi:8-oxo-dGTP diphosphatase
MDIQLFVACKAFITYQGKLLLLQESPNYKDGSNIGYYDVPGGRVKPGEAWSDGLIREIKEETGLTVEVGRPFFVNEWRPTVRGEQWQIVGIFFMCSASSDQVVLSSDHAKYIWIDPKEFKNYPVIENMIPVFEAYLKINHF